MLLQLHSRHPLHCWNTAKSTLSWVGQLLGPGIHPHDVGTEQTFHASSPWMRGSSSPSFMYRCSMIVDGPVQNNERPAKLRAAPVSQLAGASFLGFGTVFSRNMHRGSDLVASHRYHFADPLGSSSTSAWTLVCCWELPTHLPSLMRLRWRKGRSKEQRDA